jgi:hypothetical protein
MEDVEDVRIDWRRVGRRTLFALLIYLFIASVLGQISQNGAQHVYGFDFHGGIWKAGHDILAGRSPYPAPSAARLAALGNAYIPPPLLAEAFVPLALLPYWLAIAILNLSCVIALVAALRLLGVRSWQVYFLCLLSAPFVFSLCWGDPDALFVLVAAVAWRWRDSRWGGVAVGVLVAAKLVLWPLVLWLALTRRTRSAVVSVICAGGLLLGSWAAIGFKGLAQYPRFLTADARVQSTNHSLVAGLRGVGIANGPAALLALAIAVIAGLVIAYAARRSDHGWFTAATLTGLLSTAVLFPNYFMILFVPLAITHRRLSPAWLLTVALWAPIESGTWQVSIQLLIACSIAWVAVRQRATRAPALTPALSGRPASG